MTACTASCGEHAALGELLRAAEALVPDFSGDHGAALTPLVVRAAAEQAALHPGAAPCFQALLASCAWDARACAFVAPVEARTLAARLKAFLFEGLTAQGAGSYSVVYRARHKLTGAPVALKRLRIDAAAGEGGAPEGLPAVAVREASLLRELAGSPNVVRLLDVLWDSPRLYLVLEAADTDLREHLDTCPDATHPANVKSYLYQALAGVAHAHAHCVMHRDIKPQNLLLHRASGLVQVADFGLARSVAPPARAYTSEVVTLVYRAPELLLGRAAYGSAVDVWSLGCVMAELATGAALFPGDSEIGQLFQIFRVLGTPGEAAWPGVTDLPNWQPCFPSWAPQPLSERVPQLCPAGLDLLGAMLAYDPAHRITARAALAHPYFDSCRAAEAARVGVMAAPHSDAGCTPAAWSKPMPMPAMAAAALDLCGPDPRTVNVRALTSG